MCVTHCNYPDIYGPRGHDSYHTSAYTAMISSHRGARILGKELDNPEHSRFSDYGLETLPTPDHFNFVHLKPAAYLHCNLKTSFLFFLVGRRMALWVIERRGSGQRTGRGSCYDPNQSNSVLVCSSSDTFIAHTHTFEDRHRISVRIAEIPLDTRHVSTAKLAPHCDLFVMIKLWFLENHRRNCPNPGGLVPASEHSPP